MANDDTTVPVVTENSGASANVITDAISRSAHQSGEWRRRFRMNSASFKGAHYHVEQQARSSGRRIVAHEYPKRDLPYGEDMGRHTLRYTVTGYVIDFDFRIGFSADYQQTKNRLIAALESPDPGILVDPYLPITSHLDYGPDAQLMFFCERYSVSETRQRGGYCIFEMSFVEAGYAAHTHVYQVTETLVKEAANVVAQQAAAELNTKLEEIASGTEYDPPPKIPPTPPTDSSFIGAP